MADFDELAYDYAVANGWDASMVASATHAQVKLACGIVEQPNGFSFKNIRRNVAIRLQREADDALAETRRQTIITKLEGTFDVIIEHMHRGDTAPKRGWFVSKVGK